MPIYSIETNQRLPILGKIRLGIRKESKDGNSYPSTVEHFVLRDVPEVAAVYGEDPKELDVMFPMDDPESIIPTFFKWYAAGIKGKDGDIIGGKLLCYGTGPKPCTPCESHPDGFEPGTAWHLAKRDPLTRVVPTRGCMAERCPDWMGPKNQQCRQSMKVFVILPRVSWYGAYEIDTTSWYSIRSFNEMVKWVRKCNKDQIRMIPFKIIREEEATNFFDTKTGKERQGRQYIMKLKPNETFFTKFGESVREKAALAFKASEQYLLPDKQVLIERPMEDHHELQHQEQTALPPPAAKIEEISEHPEILPLFTELCKLRNVNNTQKKRLLTAKQFEQNPDPVKALKAYLEQQIQTSQQPAASQPQQQQQATPAPTQAAQPTVVEPKAPPAAEVVEPVIQAEDLGLI